MDGGGALFSEFIAALGDTVSPVVIAYPATVALDYAGLADFARTQLPCDRPYYLMGESFSGPVAITLAAERPPGLCGLILSCTFARNPVPMLRGARALIPLLPVSHHLAPALMPFLLGLRSPAALRTAVRAALTMVTPAVLKARMRAVLDVDVGAQLLAVDVPVLYLRAAQDRVVSAASLQHIQAIKPAVQAVTIDGPHLLLQAAPALAASAVVDFIASVPRR